MLNSAIPDKSLVATVVDLLKIKLDQLCSFIFCSVLVLSLSSSTN